ncbi:MAG: hypothetical protein HY433_00895 [Candidatus Liptonbacteria bacterium]|nr:hypothetical protein [Candidatus Liptonbacteria bacterium]
MKLLNRFNVAIGACAFYAINGLNAMAAGPKEVKPPNIDAPIPNADGFIAFFNQIATWSAYLFWALAVIFIFYAAFLYLTGSGEEDKIKKAHKQLLYAIIAIAVALFAYGLPKFLDSTLRTTGGGSPASQPYEAYEGGYPVSSPNTIPPMFQD